MIDTNAYFHYKVITRPSNTVLQRCLQVAGQRGIVLKLLATRRLEDGNMELHCTFYGPEQWRASLPGLLQRLVDIFTVEQADKPIGGASTGSWQS